MQITFVQSADPVIYRHFLDVTSATIKEYCGRHGTYYESFLGLKRGTKPWQAALNRIPMLQGYAEAGYRGWIIYVDADAYIADLDFDLRTYLAVKAEYAMIAAPSGVLPARWWDINNGVVAFNLGHSKCRALIERWHERLMMNSDEALAGEAKWGDVADDQQMLHEALTEIDGFEPFLYRDEGPEAAFNWENRFIRQRVRLVGPLGARLSGLTEVVREVLGSGVSSGTATSFQETLQSSANESFVNAIYRVLLGRDPDGGGFANVMRALKRGERDYTAELTSCLESEEFQAGLPELMRRHFTPASVTAVTEHLVRQKAEG